MDESIKITIAYAELVLGLPLLIAKIVWLIPSAILTKILARMADRMDQIIDGAIEGFISILSACLLFDHLQLEVVLAVPIILIIVNSLWDWSKEEFFRAWSSTAGIIAGVFLYPIVFGYFADELGLLQVLLS